MADSRLHTTLCSSAWMVQEFALSLGDGTSQLTPIQRVLLIVADVFRALFIIGPFVGLIGIYRNRIIRNKVS